ncbi:23S rRNA (pseudouridine(1915)-N(3))-methyltransferase RlmH, partial [Methylogaea oryzae]
MPSWVEEGYGEYAKRLPRECGLALKEIPMAKRQRNSDIARLVADEGQRMLAAIPDGSHVVALDVTG